MQKLKLSVLDKMMKAKLTRCEILFLCEIAKYQLNNGTVSGVFYKDVCSKIGLILPGKNKMSHQRFYDVMRSLEKKGIIKVQKGFKDYDIEILDNDFTQPYSYQQGYINLGHICLYSREFGSLKSNEMLLLLDLIKNCESNQTQKQLHPDSPGLIKIKIETFINKYKAKLGVSKRVLKGYINNLREKGFFTISITNGLMYIQQRKQSMQTFTKKVQSSQLRIHFVKKVIRHTRMQCSNKDIQHAVMVLNKYGKYLKDSVFHCFESFSKQCLLMKNSGIQNKYRWDLSYCRQSIENMLMQASGIICN